jgi:hypothetical protein
LDSVPIVGPPPRAPKGWPSFAEGGKPEPPPDSQKSTALTGKQFEEFIERNDALTRMRSVEPPPPAVRRFMDKRSRRIIKNAVSPPESPPPPEPQEKPRRRFRGSKKRLPLELVEAHVWLKDFKQKELELEQEDIIDQLRVGPQRKTRPQRALSRQSRRGSSPSRAARGGDAPPEADFDGVRKQLATQRRKYTDTWLSERHELPFRVTKATSSESRPGARVR